MKELYKDLSTMTDHVIDQQAEELDNTKNLLHGKEQHHAEGNNYFILQKQTMTEENMSVMMAFGASPH